jgi:hypothetical protein
LVQFACPPPSQPDEAGSDGERHRPTERPGNQHKGTEQQPGKDEDLDTQPAGAVPQALSANVEGSGELGILVEDLAFDLAQHLSFPITEHDAPPKWRPTSRHGWMIINFYRTTMYRETI